MGSAFCKGSRRSIPVSGLPSQQQIMALSMLEGGTEMDYPDWIALGKKCMSSNLTFTIRRQWMDGKRCVNFWKVIAVFSTLKGAAWVVRRSCHSKLILSRAPGLSFEISIDVPRGD